MNPSASWVFHISISTLFFYHCLLLKQEANVSLTGDALSLQTYIVFTAVCRSRGGAHLISSANIHTCHPAAFNSNKNTDYTVFSFGDCVHIYAALLITRSHAFELIVFSISVWHGGVHVWSLRWTPAEGWRSVLYRNFFWNSPLVLRLPANSFFIPW